MKPKAELHRIVSPDHLCPWGIKAVDTLKRHGYEVTDHHLESTEATERYKAENDVDETPDIFIEGEHIGGYDAMREHLGLGPDPKEGDSYAPIVAIFSVTFAMALAASAAAGAFSVIRVLELFIAFSMCVLGILKLQNLQSYANGFIKYDLLARRYVPYAYVYAFIEAVGGVLMIAGWLTWLIAPIILAATSLGAFSIIKAVYIEKRELNCACVGGGSQVPLGVISLTENFMMMAMAIWMLFKLV